MELKELSTVAFAPGVTSHYATSWSEDNKLSLLTSKGIHIFVLLLIFAHVPAISADDLSVPVFNYTDGKLAAFGDFDRDGRTDIAVLNRNGRSVEVLLAHETEPLMRRSCKNHYCCNFPFEVVAAAPADFDGDTHLDIAISARGSHGTAIDIYMVWGGPDGLTCPSDNASPTMSLISQPLILDYDGNTIADIFGTTTNSSQFWSFVGNRSAPLSVPLGKTRHKLRIPHSHAFLDVAGDSAADLILSTDDGYEIWAGSPNGSYSFHHFVNKPPGTVIGQSLFVDVHLEGDLFHIVPVCFGDDCSNGTLYALSDNKWLNLNPNFKDESGKGWQFYKSPSGSPITVRTGDFNMDGHPDLLATMENGNGKPEVLLLENVPCVADSCGGSGRTFTVRKGALAGLGSGCDTGAFFDLYQDGITDVVLSTEDKGSLKAFRNTLDYDANFVKVVVLAAAATDENRGRGGSLAGVRVSYRTTTQEGEHRKAAAAQLSQSAYAALQLPHSTFGLGRTPNFVDRLTVTAGGRSQDFTQEFIPNPRNSKCLLSSRRYWLKVPEIRPTSQSGLDTNRLVWKLPQACVYEMIMDASLAPDLVHTKPVPPHIIQASWSPAGVIRYHRSLLAVVLNTGAVLLFGPRGWKWLVVCNLSEIWLKHCRDQWAEVDTSDHPLTEQFHELKKRTTSLKMTMVTWGQLEQESCRFAVTHADARISVWEISVMNDAQWDAAKVQLIRHVDTKMSLPSAVLCLSIGTVVGDVDGRISVFPDVFNYEIAETVKPYVLWYEEDHIKVNAISALPQSSEHKSLGRWIILAVKKTFMIVFVLNNEGQKITEYIHRVGGLAISGLVPINFEGVIVASHTGTLSKLNIKIIKSGDVIVESENIQTNFKMKDVACYGMACSRNQGIWAVVTSICKLYDHLVLRKPGQVIFCTFLPDVEVSYCLANSAANPLVDTGEFLELIRINCLKNKTVPLLQNLLCAASPYPRDIPTLQVELWLAHMKLALLPNSGEEDKDQKMELTRKYVTELEQLLQVLHVTNALKVLKVATREKPLNMHEQMSAHLMDDWLRIFAPTASESIANIIKEALEDPLPITSEVLQEKCVICNQDFPMTADYRTSKCTNGHKLTRCSQSLRQCVPPPYFICPTTGCGAIAHKDSTNVGKSILCIYCSAILQLDERVGGGRKPVPAIYRIKPDPTSVRTDSSKLSSEKSTTKTKAYAVSDEFIEKHTYIIQAKERSKKNVNISKNAHNPYLKFSQQLVP